MLIHEYNLVQHRLTISLWTNSRSMITVRPRWRHKKCSSNDNINVHDQGASEVYDGRWRIARTNVQVKCSSAVFVLLSFTSLEQTLNCFSTGNGMKQIGRLLYDVLNATVLIRHQYYVAFVSVCIYARNCVYMCMLVTNDCKNLSLKITKNL